MCIRDRSLLSCKTSVAFIIFLLSTMIVWLICLCLFWVTIFRMLHNATPHYDNGKHSSQPKVTQKSHICIKNQSCKPCSQSENCCPTISHYNTPFHYDSFSMLTGLSIPYSLTKDHCYMSELSLFPAYVRTDIRSDWPETHSIGGCKAKGRIPPSWWYSAFARLLLCVLSPQNLR